MFDKKGGMFKEDPLKKSVVAPPAKSFKIDNEAWLSKEEKDEVENLANIYVRIYNSYYDGMESALEMLTKEIETGETGEEFTWDIQGLNK